MPGTANAVAQGGRTHVAGGTCGRNEGKRMPTERYRVPCTDGVSVQVDPTGTWAWTAAQIRGSAERAARAVMDRHGTWLDWSDWFVDVHDPKGRRVLTLAFEDAGEQRRVA